MKNLKHDKFKYDGNKRDIFGIPTFGRSMDSLLTLLDNNHFKNPVWIATINPEFVMNALKDPVFFKILTRETSINVVDGIGLLWAQEVLRSPRRTRIGAALRAGVKVLKGCYSNRLITGVELIDQLASKACQTNRSIYFFGGWGDRSLRTAEYFKKKYPGIRVADARAENFDFKIKCDYLLVARGMKKQEMWIRKNLKKLKVKVVVGVGRSFDYYSGELRRAPKPIRHMGLEWLYSLYMEPGRWRRQLALPQFIWKVLTEKQPQTAV